MYSTVLYQIFLGIYRFLDIVSGILFVYCLMTWFVRPDAPVYVFMRRLIDPIVSPFRGIAYKLMQKGVMVDVSVLLAMLAIRVLRGVLASVVLPLLMRL